MEEMKNVDILMEDNMENVDEIILQDNNGGNVLIGLGVVAVGAVAIFGAYKYLIKPLIRKIKEKEYAVLENINNKDEKEETKTEE